MCIAVSLALNSRDLDAAAQLIDTKRYRENCVGFTHGFVDWEESKRSIRQVWRGLPNLRVVVLDVNHSAPKAAIGRPRLNRALSGLRALQRFRNAEIWHRTAPDIFASLLG